MTRLGNSFVILLFSYLGVGTSFAVTNGHAIQQPRRDSLDYAKPSRRETVFIAHSSEAESPKDQKDKSCPKQEFLRSWGEKDRLSIPHGIALDNRVGKESLLVTGANKIIRYSLEGKILSQWDLKNEKSEPKQSKGLGVDSNGNVYAAIIDYPSGHIFKYSPEGKILKRWNSNPEWNGERYTDQIGGPYDVEVRGSEVFVVSPTASEITVFDPDGKYLRAIQKGEKKGPHGIGISPKGELFVANTHSLDISAHSLDGNQRRIFAEKVMPTPYDVAFDENGDVYVTSFEGNLYRFNPRGELVLQLNISDVNLPGIGRPRQGSRHLVVRGCTVYVIDGSNERVAVLGPRG